MVVTDKEGMRLDSYLSEELELSRSKVQKLIKEEKQVNKYTNFLSMV